MHPSQLPVPSLMLTFVYVAAIAVAVAHPGLPTLGGLFVLAGLTARWAARHRRRTPAQVVVLHQDAPAPATAA
ncbi:hypothetical protein [Blastococcus sp. SYSU DS1024]